MPPHIFVGDDVHSLSPHSEYRLSANAARHVALALRMRAGDALTLFTGSGGEFVGAIERIDAHDVIVRIDRHDPVERESAHPVTLVQSLIAAEMIDFVVRKAVELGAVAIVPIVAGRSQAIPAERAVKRIAHWRQIAISACEQCGRNRVPDIRDIVTFGDWLASCSPATTAILDRDAPRSLAAFARESPPDAIVVGPEGGFTHEEVRSATTRGATRVRLANRVLRSETAAIAALATLEAIAGYRLNT
ncbi:MAG TPA: 16S rRNA (uracil(1498)-N(3))-methyltransferase [Casimicrobiaceae bacterium]|nr:16S rRNA (uracil(1498)-N(3))-methyltransferase [Casimicrobiaceae bacterium]